MKSLKKLVALVLSFALVAGMSTSVFATPADASTPADQKVYVTFVANGNVTTQWIIKGTNAVAPAAPVVAGFTFCGWDKSLNNINTNTHVNAIYMINSAGDAAIAAKKASLPTPATSATGVAAPAVAAPAAAVPAAAATTASANALTPAQQQALLALLAQQQQKAQTAAATATTAVDQKAIQQALAAAAAAAQAAQKQTTTTTATQAAQTATTAANQAAAAAPAAVAAVVNFTDLNGNAGTFTQKEWQTLLNVYGGSEAVLRKHSLGDLKKVAAYYGG